MMENDGSEDQGFSAADFTFRQKITLFNKPISIQYLILSLWIISGVMGLYYILYYASYEDFVRMGILPYNLEWMVIVLSIFILVGIGLLFYPVEPMKYEKLRLEQRFDQELTQIEGFLEEAHFTKVRAQVENVLTALNLYNISQDRSALLKLLRNAEINHLLVGQIKDLQDSFEKLNSSQRTMRYKQIQAGVHENLAIVHDSVKNQLHSLSLLFSD